MNINQITIYSTCQGDGIKHYIKDYFSNCKINFIPNYQLVRDQNIHNLNNFRSLLKNTDIFIYQEMPKKWNEYSTDLSIKNNILSYLPEQSIKLVIPYVYVDWLWGLGVIRLGNGTPHYNQIGTDVDKRMKYINKEIIVNMKEEGFTLNDILTLYNDDKIDFKYDERKEKGINILKSKEKTCDVKISDFILENYKKQQLFYTPNHPLPIILKTMAKQILKKLNINYLDFDNRYARNNFDLRNVGKLLHLKSDKKYLGFEWTCWTKKIQTTDDVHNIIKKIYSIY